MQVCRGCWRHEQEGRQQEEEIHWHVWAPLLQGKLHNLALVVLAALCDWSPAMLSS